MALFTGCENDDEDVSNVLIVDQNMIVDPNAGQFKFVIKGTKDTISVGNSINVANGETIQMFFQPRSLYEDIAFEVKYTLPTKDVIDGQGKDFAAEYTINDLSSGSYNIACVANYSSSKTSQTESSISQTGYQLSASGIITIKIKE